MVKWKPVSKKPKTNPRVRSDSAISGRLLVWVDGVGALFGSYLKTDKGEYWSAEGYYGTSSVSHWSEIDRP